MLSKSKKKHFFCIFASFFKIEHYSIGSQNIQNYTLIRIVLWLFCKNCSSIIVSPQNKANFPISQNYNPSLVRPMNYTD